MNTPNYTNHFPSTDEIFDRVVNIVASLLDIDKNEIKMESLLEKDLGADGLDIVEVIMTLENEFDISFPDDIFLPSIEEDTCEEDEDNEEECEEWECVEERLDDENDEELDDLEESDETDIADNTCEPYTLTIADYVSFIKKVMESKE